MADDNTQLPADVEAQEGQASEPVLMDTKRGLFGSSLGNDTSGYGGLKREVLFPGEASKPYGSYFDEVTDGLEKALAARGADFGTAVEAVVVDRGELTLHVRPEDLLVVSQALRDEPSLRFEHCVGVMGVHYPHLAGRELHVLINLLSFTHKHRRIRLEVAVPEANPHVPSVVSVWPSANWHERETWDMFGVLFDGHPSLTRILMPDDWPGHPQRKDYPLGGVPVEYKGATVPPADERRSYN